MKQLLTVFSILFIPTFIFSQVFPVTNIMNNGNDAKRINFVMLGDGYTSTEMPTYVSDATNISNELFLVSPFLEYKDFFNVYAVEVASAESGANHPATASDVIEPVFPAAIVNNYFGSSFDFFNIHRLLVPDDNTAAVTVLATNFPSYDQVIMVVNSSEYGGSGGWLATTSTHSSASEIAIHEIGHSFASLADEYWAGDIYANERPNMTMESDPNAVKWGNWVGTNDVGIFQHGSSGSQADWHRPHQNCKMRFLNSPYCSVCKEAIIDKIYSLVTPIEDYTPLNGTVDYTGSPLDFGLSLIYPNPNTLSIEWVLNGTVIGSAPQLTLSDNLLPQGVSSLVARVTDNTALSRSYLPASGYVFTKNWTIVNNGISDVGEVGLNDNIGKFFYKAFPNPVIDRLQVEYFYNEKTTTVNVSILTIDGKEVATTSKEIVNGNGQFSLDVKDLSAGTYVIQIQNDGLKASFQVVKN